MATRGYYQDRALESRFITEEMGQRSLRSDVPINLPASYKEEALRLRNKLLVYRFRNYGKKHPVDTIVDRTLEPRLNQIFVPLLSVISDPAACTELRQVARERHREIIADRGMDIEAQVLEVIRHLQRQGSKLAVGDITAGFIARYGREHEGPITVKGIGNILRRKLHIKTYKSHGVFAIPVAEHERLEQLYEKYGLFEGSTRQAEGDRGHGEVGEVAPNSLPEAR